MPIQNPANAPKFCWENLHINDDLGEVTGEVSEGAVLAHAFAIGESPEIFINGLPGVGPFIPPSLLVNDLLKLFLIGYDCTDFGSGGGLHARSVIKYHAPLPIGASVTITGSHVAKFVRRGWRFRSMQTDVKSRGKLIAEMVATETVGFTKDNGPDVGVAPENWSDGLPNISAELPQSLHFALPNEPLERGMLLGPVARWVGLEQSVIFSGYPFAWAQEAPSLRQGLHTNYEIARRAGFSVPVVQGLLSASHLTSLLLRQFGLRLFDGSELALKFISPVFIGSRLTSYARVAGGAADDAWLLELLTQDESRSIKTVGYVKVPK